MGSPICARSIKLGMSEREEIIAYWLVPAPAQSAQFQTVVDKLANQQDAPRFHPHLSFGSFVGKEPDLTELIGLLRGLTLRPMEVAQSSSFTMSLFVRFEPSEQLLRARLALEAFPGFRTSRDFDPHISLCYGAPIEPAELQDEINALLHQPVSFDRLIATDITLPVENYDDIALWKQRSVHEIPESD